jgi:Tat protein translocase TatB subunit
MFGISGAEVMVILLVALVVLGPDRLPVVARKAGQVLGELRKVSAGFEAEMRTAMFESERPPQHPPPTPSGPNGEHEVLPEIEPAAADPDRATDEPS